MTALSAASILVCVAVTVLVLAAWGFLGWCAARARAEGRFGVPAPRKPRARRDRRSRA